MPLFISTVASSTHEAVMKFFQRFAAVPLCLLLALSGQAYAEATHGTHHDHGHEATKLSLDHGRKWATDESLRKGMETLRQAFSERLPAIHKGRLSAAQYKLLGRQTEEEVGRILAQCRLGPEADAMLHLVISDIMAGADIMQGKTKGKPMAGAHKVVSALNDYGRYFDHPGWRGLH